MLGRVHLRSLLLTPLQAENFLVLNYGKWPGPGLFLCRSWIYCYPNHAPSAIQLPQFNYRKSLSNSMQSTALFRALAIKRAFNAAFQPPSRSFSRVPHRSLLHPRLRPAQWQRAAPRHNSSLVVPESETTNAQPRPQDPSYQLTFTCKPCGNRSAHMVTKHGYHKGSILIRCPQCLNRHVISDHLKIFMDEKSTLEDILRRTAGTDKDISKLIKKGKLGVREGAMIGTDGEQDIEFWDDGTQTDHIPAHPRQ